MKLLNQVLAASFLLTSLSSSSDEELNRSARDGIRVVKKKRKILSSSESNDLPREGRHLGIFAPLADIYLRMQCSVLQCQASVSTAQICCNRNFNIDCCYHTQSHLYFSPSPPLPTLWQKPALPFSLGVSFELTEHQEPVYQEHHAHQHHEHHDYPDYHDQHYPQHRYKPGICPEPDRDYYNRPGFYDSGGYNFPRVPGSSDLCSYDSECPGVQKCCHLAVGHHQITMLCRYPKSDNWNGWKR